MKVYFNADKPEQTKELENIICSVAKTKFNTTEWGYEKKDSQVIVDIQDRSFLKDLEDAKDNLYIAKNMGDTASLYMKDFISEVQENLSFVVKVE